MFGHDLIVIGASAGGVEAIRVIAGALPGDLPAAVLFVLHSSPQGPWMLPRILGRTGPVEVAEVVDGAPIRPGAIYLAPPDHHLLVNENRIRLSKGPKENGTRPAIDPLFRTAAAAYGPRVVGVILTGMLDDGTAGLSAVRAHGGTAVVQDPEDAVYPSMPKNALRYAGADYTVPLSEIAPLLVRLAKEPARNPENLPVSPLDEIESKFVQMQNIDTHEMDAVGTHAGLSCPECHGPIWKLEDGKVQRYRCHVGHAYSAQAMAAGQIEAQETHLWQALRLMKERASLIQEMRCHADEDQHADEAAAYDAKVRELQGNIEQIQSMLQQEEPPPA